MRVTITYIHHNCFGLRRGDQTFLFDYPGKSHLPDGAESLVQKFVAGTDLSVFISHSHDDHCNDDLVSMAATARQASHVLSDDVADMRPGAVPEGVGVLIVEPDETYAFNGMVVETLLSNDLGVAFLVEVDGLRLYYGGDLAKWIWKTASRQEAAFTTDFFRAAMDRVRAFRPHVAFCNVDRRLENLAGGVEAYRDCGAQVFVPMHAFGEPGWLKEFPDMVEAKGPQLFMYETMGDNVVYDLRQSD